MFTFEAFIEAAARYPMFCGEKATSNSNSLDDVCRMELATFFANSTQETGGNSQWDNDHGCLFHKQSFALVYEVGCNLNPSACSAYNGQCTDPHWGKVYPCASGQYYFGRGPLQMSWNYNYGAFGLVTTGNVSTYLRNPDAIAQTGGLAFLSAFWFYMSPSSPKPSIHETVVGFFTPNSADRQTNNGPNFGTTINIINGGIECGYQTSQAQKRGNFLKSWMADFGLGNNSYAKTGVDCLKNQAFSASGWSNTRDIYWSKSGSKCSLKADNTSIHPIWLKNGENMCNSS